MNKIFLVNLCMTLALVSLDALSWFIEGTPGKFLYYLNWIITIVVFSLSMLVINVFLLYVVASISLPREAERKIMNISYVLTGIYHLILLVSICRGGIFLIDENNSYHIGAEYTESILIMLPLIMTELIIVLICYRKRMCWRDLITFLIYAVVILAAGFLNAFIPQVTFSYAVMSLVLLAVFVNIQIQRERQMLNQTVILREQQAIIMLSQLQPHFLYNVLTAINVLCKDNRKAQKSVVVFSKFLRTNMNALTKKEPIPFRMELEHTQNYLWLEKLRFEERLEIIYDIRVKDFEVPVLTLQAVTANAVQRGVAERQEGGTVIIRTRETTHYYQIRVEDDGVGFVMEQVRKDKKNYIDLHHVKEQLAAMCGGELEIQSIPGEGTTTTITIPKLEEGS